MAVRIVPKTQLRDRIRAELAKLGDHTLVVTERGRPVAITVSVDRWNSLQERLEDLEDSLAVLEHRGAPDDGVDFSTVIEKIETDVRSSTHSEG